MKEEKEEKYFEEDETVELEELTEIQGGIEGDAAGILKSCGLGCFLSAGYI